MSQYIKNICIIRDRLASAGERMKEPHIILITLGGLRSKYKHFVTSITTRFDHNMTFSNLQQLLMDYEFQESPTPNIVEINTVSKQTKLENAKACPCQSAIKKDM